MAKQRAQVIVEVRGGNVVGVYADQALQVWVLDWDNIDGEPDVESLVPDFDPAESMPNWFINRDSTVRSGNRV